MESAQRLIEMTGIVRMMTMMKSRGGGKKEMNEEED